MKRTTWFLLCLLIFFAGSLSARNTTIESMGVRITAVPDYSSRPISGYCFYSVVASNRSSSEKEVRLTMRTSYSGELEQVSRTFKLAANESRIESLFFPIMDFSADGMKVEIDGVQVSEKVFPYVSIYRDYYRKKQTLVDNRVSRSEFEAVFGKGHGSYDLEMNMFEGSLSQLDTRWLAYARFNSMIFYADSMAQMSNEVRSAIYDYIRAGGTLLVLGDFTPPEDFSRLDVENPSGIKNLQGYESGFGRLLVTDEDILSRVATASGNPFPDLVSDPFSSVTGRGRSPIAFNDNDVNVVSSQWLMIIIYAFAFLIGPVNVYVLHKLGRKIWVFWTVPVASAICCLFIFAYYWLFESSTMMVRKQALTFIDERNNHAVTLGNLAVYSSSSRPEGFRFSYDTEIIPVAQRSYRSTDGGKFIYLDEDQHLADGWIRPKIPRYLHMRKVHLSRERLTLEGSGGNLKVLNGLGARIRLAFVMTGDGNIYKCDGVEAGQKAALFSHSQPLKSRRRFRELSRVFREEWHSHFDELYRNPQNYLQPGMYLALLEGAPFLKKQSFEKSDTDATSVVVGIMGGES